MIFIILTICACCGADSASHYPSQSSEARKPIYLLVSNQFTEQEFIAIESCAVEWTEKTQGFAQFFALENVSQDMFQPVPKVILIDKVPPSDPVVLRLESQVNSPGAKQLDTIAYYDPPQHKIGLVQGRTELFSQSNEKKFKSTVKHELGHVLGLSDNKIHDSVMNGVISNGSDHVTERDVVELCQVQRCPERLILSSQR